ncbi:type II toxin-antitoxin system HicA family toxin [Accumulibacter sp.]|nr:type II toxin-antitoxin system HicA family toxin [Accumulibacter sp.]
MRCSSPGLRSRLVRLRVFSGSDLCRLLGDHGFEVVRQRGSHAVMQKRTAGTTVTVPSRCTTKSASGRFNPSSASQACPSLCSSKVEHSGLRRKRLVFVSPAPKGHGASHRTVTRVAAGTVDRSRKRGLTPISWRLISPLPSPIVRWLPTPAAAAFPGSDPSLLVNIVPFRASLMPLRQK